MLSICFVRFFMNNSNIEADHFVRRNYTAGMADIRVKWYAIPL